MRKSVALINTWGPYFHYKYDPMYSDDSVRCENRPMLKTEKMYATWEDPVES